MNKSDIAIKPIVIPAGWRLAIFAKITSS
jgi:hypothetical protein